MNLCNRRKAGSRKQTIYGETGEAKLEIPTAGEFMEKGITNSLTTPVIPLKFSLSKATKPARKAETWSNN